MFWNTNRTPALAEHHGFQEHVELFARQQLVAQLAVEDFHVAILPRPSRFDKQCRDADASQPHSHIWFNARRHTTTMIHRTITVVSVADSSNAEESSLRCAWLGGLAFGYGTHCPGGGCQSSTLLPSGSMTQPNFPYSESSVFSRTLHPSSRSA
jgi:hypothetical protein